MAGAVLISKDVGVSMSSIAFDHIVEKTRKKFGDAEKNAMEDIYRPYDHEGMMFIDLQDASLVAFNAFCRATSAARIEDLAHTPDSPQDVWNELCEKLANDTRFGA